MGGTFQQFTKQEFEDVVLPMGFKPMNLPSVYERVYGKVVRDDEGRVYSIRVYSTIEGEIARKKGGDAIRVYVYTKNFKGEVVPLGGDKRVNRTDGWRDNLKSRIDNWKEWLDEHPYGPLCPKCGDDTRLKRPAKGKQWKPFFGCINYPKCDGSHQYKGE